MTTEVATKRKQFADQLLEAEKSLIGMSPLNFSRRRSLQLKKLTHIQLENIERKVAQGQKIVGKKIGLTSKAMQDAARSG